MKSRVTKITAPNGASVTTTSGHRFILVRYHRTVMFATVVHRTGSADAAGRLFAKNVRACGPDVGHVLVDTFDNVNIHHN